MGDPNLAGFDGAVVGRSTVGTQPCALEVAGDGRVWTTLYGAGAVVEVDPSDGSVIQQLRAGGEACGIAEVDGYLWIATLAADGVVSIDPATGDQEAYVPLDDDPWDLQFGDGSLWAAGRSGVVSRIDPTTDTVIATIDLGTRLSGLATVDGGVWVAVEGDNSISRIDTATNEVASTVALPGAPVWFAVSEDSLWVSSAAASEVYRVDLSTEQVTAEIAMAEIPLDLSYGVGAVWVPNRAAGVVTRIDPATNDTTEITVKPGIYVTEPVGARIWALDFAEREIYLIDPALVG